MGKVIDRINTLKIKLPEPKPPVGAYVATKIIGKLLYISGQISTDSEGKLIKGKVGKDLNVDEGYQAAIRCALSIVAQSKKATNGDLSKIKKCIKKYIFSEDFNVNEENNRMIFQDDDGLLDLDMPTMKGSFQIQNASGENLKGP